MDNININESLELEEVTVTTSGRFNGICTLKNNVIKLNGFLLDMTFSGGWNTNILKIPYKPLTNFYFPATGYGNSTTYAVAGYIDMNGEIKIYSPAQGLTEVHFNLVYDI